MAPKRSKSKQFGKSKGKKSSNVKKFQDKRRVKVAHASQIVDTKKDDNIDEDLMKFEGPDLDDSIDEDEEEFNALQDSDLEMDLSEQDENDEKIQQKGDDIDLEDELIVGGTSLQEKFSKKRSKVRKEDDVIEKPAKVEFDEKSMTQVDKIKRICDAVDSGKDVTLSYATKLLEIFRMAMNIDQDNTTGLGKVKDKLKDKTKKTKEPKQEKEQTDKDKTVSIVLASSTSIYAQVCKVAIEKLPKIIVKSFKGKLNFDDNSEANLESLKKAYRGASKTQTILMKSFIANYLKLLKSSKDMKLLITFLPSIVDIIKLVFPYQKYKRILINCLLTIMCRSYFNVDKKAPENSTNCILICFDAIRKLLSFDYLTHEGLATYTFKKFLNVFGDSSREGGAGSSDGKVRDNLRVLENCFCELLSIDYTAAYQVCFALIRKLANVCKVVRSNTSKKAVQGIVNWQYHHNLHLLSVAIYTHTLKSEELNLLIYPHTQLCIATLEILLKNTVYFPYSLKICKMLNTMGSVSDDLYIPVATYLLHLFTGKDQYFNRKTKSTKQRLPNYSTALKITKEFYDVKETQEYVFKCCIAELKTYLNNNLKSVAFPELTVPILHTLKVFRKESKNLTYTYIVRDLIKKIHEVNSMFNEKRKGISVMNEKQCQKLEQSLEFKDLFKITTN